MLNAITYLDMAVRARPSSDTPSQAVERFARKAGTQVPDEGDERGNRLADWGRWRDHRRDELVSHGRLPGGSQQDQPACGQLPAGVFKQCLVWGEITRCGVRGT